MTKQHIQIYIQRTIWVCLLFSFASINNLLAAREPKANEEKLYEIDIIVFATKNSQTSKDASEYWPEKVEFPNFSGSLEILSPYEYLVHQGDISEEKYIVESSIEAIPDDLSDYAETLDKHENYELIFRKIWRQAMKPQKLTTPVFVSDAGKNYLYQNTDPNLLQQQKSGSPEPLPSEEQELLQDLLNEKKLLNQPVQTQAGYISDRDPMEPFEYVEIPVKTNNDIELDYGPPQHKLFGLIKVFKARFPHFAFNLFYKDEELDGVIEEKPEEELFPMAVNTEETEPLVEEPMTVPENILVQEKPPRPAYQLKVSSRIRLNEVYYFDHPKFGVISRIRRYEPPQEDDSSTSEAEN